MFEFLFKYPTTLFSKGDFVLLGAWPKWALFALIFASASALALLIWKRIVHGPTSISKWKVAVLWLLQSCMVALLLLLLWQPAISVAELKPQQNIIMVMVDDSQSMSITENGSTRQAQAVKALQDGTLAELQKNFQTRIYRLDNRATRIGNLSELQNSAPSTRIGDSLKQVVAETSDLPVGGIVLLTDGSDNSGGIDLDTISALRNRHIPVHAVGFGEEKAEHDIEMDDAVVGARSLPDSRLSARVTFRQRGYSGQKSILTVRDGQKALASHEITFGEDGEIQTESLLFNAGSAGAKSLQFSIDPLPGEENRANNSLTRLVNVDAAKRRILYVEGEPRWEYKFIRRAEDGDQILEIASMLRTTENKIYRQGIQDPKELADGFPSKPEDLFGYQGLIIGSVEAGYFTPAQQDLIRQFVDRRGGGLLLLGGRFALADGGWAGSSLGDLLPTSLPTGKSTFHREPATVELTGAGTDSIITRLVDDPQRNVDRWKKLPYLMDYQELGTPKPGAAVLAEMRAGGKTLPLLVTENYGRGRTAVMATSGTWRWQMSQPLGDTTHDMFWQQLLRWIVSDSPGPVVASVPSQQLNDDGHITISVDVRDKSYLPAGDAHVQAHVIGPGGLSTFVDLTPVPDKPGSFQVDWNAEKPGSYVAEITASRGDQELGRDVVPFQRLDGVAENFHTEQNRDLLEKLSSQTGGRYYTPADISKLPGEIPYSSAGITMHETKELWNMPIIFLVLVLLRFSEWLLRRKWGIV